MFGKFTTHFVLHDGFSCNTSWVSFSELSVPISLLVTAKELQQSCFKGLQFHLNRFYSKGRVWAFSVGSWRAIFENLHNSLAHTPPQLILSYFLILQKMLKLKQNSNQKRIVHVFKIDFLPRRYVSQFQKIAPSQKLTLYSKFTIRHVGLRIPDTTHGIIAYCCRNGFLKCHHWSEFSVKNDTAWPMWTIVRFFIFFLQSGRFLPR